MSSSNAAGVIESKSGCEYVWLPSGCPAARHACSTASVFGSSATFSALMKPYTGGSFCSFSVARIDCAICNRLSSAGRSP